MIQSGLHEVRRKDPSVAKLVQHLDEHFKRCVKSENGNRDAGKSLAWATLSSGEMRLIKRELAKVRSHKPEDVRYYLENYHAIRTKDGELTTLWPFWEPQETMWEDFEECWRQQIPVFWIFLKSRQIGWSTLLQGIGFSRIAFHAHIDGLILAEERSTAGVIFDMARLAWRNLPWWMQPEVQYEQAEQYLRFDRKKKADREGSPGLQSNIYVDAANKYTGAGRGKALQFCHCTEIQLYRDVRIITRDIRPAVNKHSPTTVFALEGTGRGVNTFFQEMWKAAEDETNEYFPLRPVFAPFWMFKSYSKDFKSKAAKEDFILDAEEQAIYERARSVGCQVRPGKVVKREITKEQFLWYRIERELVEKAEASSGNSEFGGVYQEYPPFPDMAWQMEGLPAFDPRWLRRIEAEHVRDPLWWGDIKLAKVEDGEFKPVLVHGPKEAEPARETERQRERRMAINRTHMLKSPLWIWDFPKGGTFYTAADPGHGIQGKDRSGIEVWWSGGDATSPAEQVAEYAGWTPPKPTAERAAALGWLFNDCEVCPERNLDALVEHLVYTFRYPRVWRKQRKDTAKPGMHSLFGWQMTKKNRNGIIAAFREEMRQEMLVIRSKRLLDECRSFVDDGTGPPGSPHFEAVGEGSRDDLLIAAMIASYLLPASQAAACREAPEELGEPAVYRCLGCGRHYEWASRRLPGKCPLCFKQAGFVPSEDFCNTDHSPIYDGPRGGGEVDFLEL